MSDIFALQGHLSLEERLSSLMSGSKLPHALLFSGPQGIGKMTMALKTACQLLSASTPKKEADSFSLFNDHPAATSTHLNEDVVRRVLNRNHSDVHIVEAEEGETIDVDSIRKITDFMQMTAAESPWRITLIDGAEKMTLAAANALLKILEEPPTHGLLILVTHAPGKLLPTIRSRCQRFQFRPLTTDQVTDIISRTSSLPDPRELDFYAAVSQGSPGFALKLLAANAYQHYAKILEVLSEYPRIKGSALHALVKTIAFKDGVWSMHTYMMDTLLARAQAVAANLPTPVLHPAESPFFEKIRANPAQNWQELWQLHSTWREATSRVHLDKKSVSIATFQHFAA